MREVRSLARLGIPAHRTRPLLECLTAGQGQADDCPVSLAAYRDAITELTELTELTERIEALTAKRAALTTQLRQAAHRTSSVSTGEDERTVMTDLDQLPPDLPAPESDGAADHLAGETVPVLTLPATSGQDIALDQLGAGRTVLYVYPLTGRPDVDLPEGWDNIPGARGCTAEACDFRDYHGDLLAAGAARVFGLSSQDGDYQREVVARLRLPFAMLSDTSLALAKALKLPTFRADGMNLFKRLTLVISGGTVEHAFYPIFPPNEHAQQVLAWLRSHAAEGRQQPQ